MWAAEPFERSADQCFKYTLSPKSQVIRPADKRSRLRQGGVHIF